MQVNMENKQTNKTNLQVQILKRCFVNISNLRTTDKPGGLFSILKDSRIILPRLFELLFRGRNEKKGKTRLQRQ